SCYKRDLISPERSPIKLSKERARQHWQPATEKEISALRAVNGALGEAQCFSSASGIAEWCMLILSDKGEPLDLLRSVFRNARYQLADEKEEMQLVRDILARMEAQGTPMPPALWSSGHLGAMSDGSKRLRDQDDFPSSEDELLGEKCTGRTSEDFELIRDAPKSSVESVEKWGATICALPEVKEEAPTYHEIGTLSKFKEYRN
ncbi:unnamed protein product, partial [Cladocopium goreaui]